MAPNKYTAEEVIAAFKKPRQTKTSKEAENSKHLDINEVRRALTYLDPSNREVWINVGHEMKSEGESLRELYLEWSRSDLTGTTPNSFVSDEEVYSKWEEFDPSRTSISSLYRGAEKNGYEPPHDSYLLDRGTTVESANYLLSKMSLKGPEPVFSEGSFWQYEQNHWVKIPNHDLRRFVHKLDGIKVKQSKKPLNATSSFIDGVLKEMAAMCANPDFFSNAPCGANLQNGFVRLNDDGALVLEDHSPRHLQRNVIKCNWLPDITEEFTGYTRVLLDGCFGESDRELQNLLLEIIGVTILGVSTRMKAPKGIVFFGATASNGKSTILSLIRLILPHSATCSIPPSDFEREQSLATLVGKTANLTDEISNHKSIASDKMKSLITGDIVAAKVVYQPVFNFKPVATHIFATNELPNFKGGVDAGVERRMLVIPFTKTIPEEKRITDLEELIADKEASLLVSAAISIGGKAYQRGTFNIPASCKGATEQWFKDSDPVREWYAEGEIRRHVNHKPKLLKELYKNFCDDIREFEDANYLPGKRRFIAQIKALVETDVDWRIERHGGGLMICRSSLV